MFFSSKHPKEILVLDIGTASVNAILARHAAETGLEVITSSRLGLKLLENPDFKSMWRYVKEALAGIFSAFRKDGARVRPDFIFVVFSSPWYLSQTRIIRLERPQAFTVNSKLLEEMISEELRLFTQKSQEKFQLSSEGIYILEHDVMKAALNGYPVRQAVGKKARELELCLFMSLSRRELMEELRNILEHWFGRCPVKISSSSLELFRILSERLDAQEGFLLADVGGEITEISLVHGRIIEEVLTFARGGHFIVRNLASNLGIGLEEAFALLRSKTRGELKDSLDKKVTAVLEAVGKEWFRLFAQAVSELGRARPLPQNLVLVGGAAGLEVLKKFSGSEELSQFTILGRPFSVITLLPENLDSGFKFGNIDRKDPQMTLPLLLSLAAEKYVQ